jgi:hypothetical protein
MQDKRFLSDAYLDSSEYTPCSSYLSRHDSIQQTVMAVIAWYKTAMPRALCERRIAQPAFLHGRNCNHVDLWQTTRHGL